MRTFDPLQPVATVFGRSTAILLIQGNLPFAKLGKIQPSVHDWNRATRDVHGMNHSTAFQGAS